MAMAPPTLQLPALAHCFSLARVSLSLSLSRSVYVYVCVGVCVSESSSNHSQCLVSR